MGWQLLPALLLAAGIAVHVVAHLGLGRAIEQLRRELDE
jgi:hypothetical protein